MGVMLTPSEVGEVKKCTYPSDDHNCAAGLPLLDRTEWVDGTTIVYIFKMKRRFVDGKKAC